ATKTDLAKTGGTMMPAPVAVSPLTMKSRRVIMSPASLELEFGAGEQRVPLVGVTRARIDDRSGVRSDDTVELRLHGGNRIGVAVLPCDDSRGEIHARQPRTGRDPSLVGRPARD